MVPHVPREGWPSSNLICCSRPEGAGVLPLPEALLPLFSPSTKQLELWFSSLQEDAGQRLKWERMGLLGYEGGGEGKGLVCWFPLMPE